MVYDLIKVKGFHILKHVINILKIIIENNANIRKMVGSAREKFRNGEVIYTPL